MLLQKQNKKSKCKKRKAITQHILNQGFLSCDKQQNKNSTFCLALLCSPPSELERDNLNLTGNWIDR